MVPISEKLLNTVLFFGLWQTVTVFELKILTLKDGI